MRSPGATLTSPRSVAEVVRGHLEGAQAPHVEAAVFGTESPTVIGSMIEEFCVEQLAAGVAAGLFFTSSVGCVVGVQLADGRRVVIKAYQSRWTRPFLAAVARVEHRLASAGFACPDIVLGAARLPPATGNVETYLPDPGVVGPGSTVDLGASASGLADQIGRCRDLREPALADHPLHSGGDHLYPEPHSPQFDFTVDADGAGWIDELALRAREARDGPSLSAVIAHCDWTARNVRIREGRLVAVYDWDSLSLVAEAIAVGQAAATWRLFGGDDPGSAPGPEEVSAYVAAYEAASGRRFAREEHRVARAAALWVRGYAARCEPALEATTGIVVETSRSGLAADARGLLDG